MATFPVLRTGAVAQYPLEHSVRFRTDSVRFLDGSTQRFPLTGRGLRRWKIRLEALDHQELETVIDFVEQQENSSFTFVDPLTGTSVPNCILANESFEAAASGEVTGNATLEIEETL